MDLIELTPGDSYRYLVLVARPSPTQRMILGCGPGALLFGFGRGGRALTVYAFNDPPYPLYIEEKLGGASRLTERETALALASLWYLFGKEPPRDWDRGYIQWSARLHADWMAPLQAWAQAAWPGEEARDGR